MVRRITIPLNDEQVKGMLRRYDTNGDGRLSWRELREAFHSFGLRFCSWKAWLALRHADANGDGVISEDEIMDLIKYSSKWGFSIS